MSTLGSPARGSGRSPAEILVGLLAGARTVEDDAIAAEAARLRARALDDLRENPLAVRYLGERARSVIDRRPFRNSAPWQAQAERDVTAATLALVALDKCADEWVARFRPSSQVVGVPYPSKGAAQ